MKLALLRLGFGWLMGQVSQAGEHAIRVGFIGEAANTGENEEELGTVELIRPAEMQVMTMPVASAIAQQQELATFYHCAALPVDHLSVDLGMVVGASVVDLEGGDGVEPGDLAKLYRRALQSLEGVQGGRRTRMRQPESRRGPARFPDPSGQKE